MDRTTSLMRKGNPLRSDLSWWAVLLMGLVALAVGIYILSAEASARKNFVFAIGLFLLINGVSYAAAGIKARQDAGPMMPYLLIRSGIGIATGLIVVLNRLVGSMDLNQSRVIAGIGLLGMGAVTIVGMVLVRGDDSVRIGAVIGALFLAIWGIATLYQAANNASTSRLIGWLAVIAGLAYCAIALYRRRAAMPATARA